MKSVSSSVAFSLKLIAYSVIACAMTGCGSIPQKQAATFIDALKKMHLEAADVSQSTVTPIYNHSESAAGIVKSEKNLTVENVKASFNIPIPFLGIPLLQWNFSASHIAGAKDDSSFEDLIPHGTGPLKP